MINRLSKTPKIVRVLFLSQATTFFVLGVSVLLMLDPKEIKRDPLALESISIHVCAASILAFALGSLLAIRIRTWREVEIMIQTTIMFYVITIITLAAVTMTHNATMVSWISILACFGGGSIWCWIYFKYLKEVRGPGINIKEF